MLLCPIDLEACLRPGCSAGCERTAEPRLAVCWECGVVMTSRATTYVCRECGRDDAPVAENGG